MQVAIITLFPSMFQALSQYGVVGRALDQKKATVKFWNPRDFTTNAYQQVDDRPYGGGPGMVLMAEPLLAAIRAARAGLSAGGCDKEEIPVVYLTPQGKPLDQRAVQDFAKRSKFILLSGRYEGIDERVIDLEVDEEWSIGDYVLSGGELPAMVLLDAAIRLLPGVVGHHEATASDSFSFAAGLLDYPHYTRPQQVEGQRVPAVLCDGDHQKIARWRQQQALGRTWEKRSELLAEYPLTQDQLQLLEEYQRQRDSSSSS